MEARAYEVRVEGEETRFILPMRRRRLPHVLIAVGCFVGALGFGGLGVYLIFGSGNFRSLMLFVWAVMLGSRARVMFFRGHGEVCVNTRRDEARVSHRAGEKGGWDSFEVTEIERLEIDEARDLRRRFSLTETVLDGELANGTRVTLAREYPRAMLEALAGELRPLLEEAKARAMKERQEVAVVDVSGVPSLARDVLRQPHDSKIVATHVGDVHSYVMPRWGVLRTVWRFVVFSAMVVGVLALAAIVIYTLLETAVVNRPAGWERVVFYICCGMGVVVAIWVAGLHFFLRRAVILVTGEGRDAVLMRVAKGPLGSRGREWKASEIRHLSTDTRASSSSFTLKSPNETLLRLVLKPVRGRRRMLAEGAEYEMRWLATELRRLLGVGNISS